MRKIVLKAFVLLGFTIQACTPLTAATQNADVKAAKQDVGQPDDPRGQGHQFARHTATGGTKRWAVLPPTHTQNSTHFKPTHGLNITKNDRTDTAQKTKKYRLIAFFSAPAGCEQCDTNALTCINNWKAKYTSRAANPHMAELLLQCYKARTACIKRCK